MTEEMALVKRPDMPIRSFEEVKQEVEELNKYYRQLMQKGTDYDTIPGTPKPTLLKPGAEILRARFGFNPEFHIDDTGTNRETGIYIYMITCSLYKDMELVAQGVGSCSSLESKYHYRWLFPNQVPKGANKEELPIRWVKGKQGQIPQYRMDVENLHDQANTILKMAKKRAFVDAILTATGASRIFTQDVEDVEGAASESEVSPTVETLASGETMGKEHSMGSPMEGKEEWRMWLEVCPEHGVVWFPGRYGRAHKCDDCEKGWCNLKEIFKGWVLTRQEQLGWGNDQMKDWLKERYGGTWSKLTEEQQAEAIHKLELEVGLQRMAEQEQADKEA